MTQVKIDSTSGTVISHAPPGGGSGAPGSLTVHPSGQFTITAGTQGVTWINPNGPPTTDNVLHTLEGELVTASISLTNQSLQAYEILGGDDDIKSDLCKKLAEKLMACKMIEFTRERMVTDDSVIFRARIFATPDNKVRLIRELQK